MTRPFLEERINDNSRIGTSFELAYDVINTTTGSGGSFGQAFHPYEVLRASLEFGGSSRDFARDYLLDFYRRSNGTLGGFRVKNHLDFSTNGATGTPTSTDQICLETATTNVFQIIKWYGTQGDTTQARRNLYKPVTGSVMVSDNDITIVSGFTVDYTNGQITFSSAPSGTVKAGCLYDVPMRFESDLNDLTIIGASHVDISIDLIELLNP